MPVFSPSRGGASAGSVDQDDPRRGKIPRQFAFSANQGIPRFEDLLSLRVLERSPTISLPMNTVRTQVTTPDWGVRPTVDNPTSAHNEAADELERWLEGNFNANEQSFENLLKLLVTDLLSPDTGTLELVPTESAVFDDGSHAAAEIYHLDGITMSKELDEHGVIPEPPEPAYYQFAPRSAMRGHDWNDVLDALGSHRTSSILRAYGRQQHESIPFTRDQVVWLERNPQSATNYGFGKVQQVRKWAEILLNVDLSNATYFSDNEIPQGIMAIQSGSETELRRNRQYMRDTIRGETDHVAPMFDASPDQIDWIPIQGTPEELQFLDSQQWYHKLMWFIFGLNQGEIGDFESGNRSMGEYHSRQVFRQTTRPIIDDIVGMFNDGILPKKEAYWRVDGELEFFADLNHEMMEALERERQTEDLQQGLTTPNEVRQERGKKEELPWGDMPPELRTALARKHPEWAAEQWADIDPDDLPDSGLGDLDLLSRGGRQGASPAAAALEGDTGSQDDVDEDRPKLYVGPNENGEVPPEYEHLQEEADADGYVPLGEVTHNATEDEEGNWTPPAIRADDAGEVEDEVEGLATLIRDLENESRRLVEDALADVQDTVDEQWPEDGSDQGGLLLDVDGLATVDVADALQDPVLDANTQAMEAAAEDEAARLEDELEERYGVPPEVADVSIDFDVVDTFAWEAMRRRVQQNAVTIEGTVEDQVRSVLLEAAADGAPLDEVQDRLEEASDEISHNRARTIARTEVPQASREGSQALAESTDVVGGKKWDATGDSRSRPWHDAMDGVIIEVDDSWTVPSGWQGKPDYQPSDYPRTAHTVGEDQPYNCRCAQLNVLDDDMPEDLQALDDIRGVDVDLQVSDRQFEVWRDHARDGEGFVAMLERLDREHSRTQLVDELGVSKNSLYRWFKDAGIR